jgi:hypothetical protein
MDKLGVKIVDELVFIIPRMMGVACQKHLLGHLSGNN